jgi:hypothetical protein
VVKRDGYGELKIKIMKASDRLGVIIANRKLQGFPLQPELPYPPYPCLICKNMIEENDLFIKICGLKPRPLGRLWFVVTGRRV